MRWGKRLLACAAMALLHGALIGLVIVSAPAGEVIAYSAPGRSTQDIFIEDLSRGIVRNITASFKSHHETAPSWSPDGLHLVFSASADSYAPSDLYVIGMDGSRLRRLTTFAGNDFHPAWSPDGGQIAYASYQGSSVDIYVAHANGSSIRQLNASAAYDNAPTWSSDGRWIAFHSVQEGRQWISVIAADGSGERVLIEGNYHSPAWSPDGARVAVLSSGGEIVIIEMGHGSLQTLELPGMQAALTWLPDGSQLAYLSTRCDCAAEVYILDIERGGERRLGSAHSWGDIPVWRP